MSVGTVNRCTVKLAKEPYSSQGEPRDAADNMSPELLHVPGTDCGGGQLLPPPTGRDTGH